MPKKPKNKKTESETTNFNHVTNEEFLFWNMDFGDIEEIEPKSKASNLKYVTGKLDLDFTPERIITRLISRKKIKESEKPKELSYHSKHVKDYLEGFIKSIENIKSKNDGRAINLQADEDSGFAVSPNALIFYVPLFLFNLFENYGFHEEIKRLRIMPPRIKEEFTCYRFEKDLLLANKDGVFVYSCTFKRAIKNYLNIDSIFMYRSIANFAELISNCTALPDPVSDPCRCDEHSIRNSDFVRIYGKSYLDINDYLFQKDKLTYED